jgi:hypothetical protein
LLGTIHLSTKSGQSFKVAALQVGSRKNCFTIESPGRLWFLQANSELEMVEWIGAIRDSTLCIKKNVRSSPKSIVIRKSLILEEKAV